MDTLKLVDKLYYTIEHGDEYVNLISIYVITDNEPKLVAEIDYYPSFLETMQTRGDIIQSWLDENGYEDFEYEFIRL
jgi:hypothetical protein